MRDAKIHIYTGNGKGKTTAAFGLCLRAYGHGKNILIVQFRKGTDCGERAAAAKLGLPILLCGGGRESRSCSSPCKLLEQVKKIISASPPDIMVLDEIMAAVRNGCVAAADVLAVTDRVKAVTEIVMTGRNAPRELLSAADLITSMEPVKHYFTGGVKARKGVEY